MPRRVPRQHPRLEEPPSPSRHRSTPASCRSGPGRPAAARYAPPPTPDAGCTGTAAPGPTGRAPPGTRSRARCSHRSSRSAGPARTPSLRASPPSRTRLPARCPVATVPETHAPRSSGNPTPRSQIDKAPPASSARAARNAALRSAAPSREPSGRRGRPSPLPRQPRRAWDRGRAPGEAAARGQAPYVEGLMGRSRAALLGPGRLQRRAAPPTRPHGRRVLDPAGCGSTPPQCSSLQLQMTPDHCPPAARAFSSSISASAASASASSASPARASPSLMSHSTV